MLLKLFKGNQPVLIIIIPVLTGLLWIKSFITPSDFILNYELHEMPFWHFINTHTAGLDIVRKIIAFILLIINALWLARINTKFILINVRTYIPALFFGFICSSLVFLQNLNPALFAVSFFVPAIEKMFDSYKEEKLSYKYFEAALLISLGSLFYARAALFMFVIWTALSVLRTTNWREWTLSVAGFILPYIFLVIILYLTDRNIPDYFSKIASNFRITRGIDFLNLYNILFLAFVLFLVGISSLEMIRIYQALKIYARVYYRVLFWIFIFTLIFIFIFYNSSAELIYFLAIPVSYILSFYFYSLKLNWLGEILFTSFIGLLILGIIMG
jgi:hypothetical protein